MQLTLIAACTIFYYLHHFFLGQGDYFFLGATFSGGPYFLMRVEANLDLWPQH